MSIFFIRLSEGPNFASIQKNGASPVNYILLFFKILDLSWFKSVL